LPVSGKKKGKGVPDPPNKKLWGGRGPDAEIVEGGKKGRPLPNQRGGKKKRKKKKKGEAGVPISLVPSFCWGGGGKGREMIFFFWGRVGKGKENMVELFFFCGKKRGRGQTPFSVPKGQWKKKKKKGKPQSKALFGSLLGGEKKRKKGAQFFYDPEARERKDPPAK